MDQNFLNGLLSHVNSAEAPTFVWGFPGVSSAGRAELLAARAGLVTADVERALTLLCGELCGLKLDRAIFRHEFPREQDEACALRLEGESADDAPEYRTFTARFTARSPVRDWPAQTVATLLAKLPPVWVTVNSRRLGSPVVFAAVEPGKKNSVDCRIGNGKELFSAETELRVRVCTALPPGI